MQDSKLSLAYGISFDWLAIAKASSELTAVGFSQTRALKLVMCLYLTNNGKEQGNDQTIRNEIRTLQCLCYLRTSKRLGLVLLGGKNLATAIRDSYITKAELGKWTAFIYPILPRLMSRCRAVQNRDWMISAPAHYREPRLSYQLEIPSSIHHNLFVTSWKDLDKYMEWCYFHIHIDVSDSDKKIWPSMLGVKSQPKGAFAAQSSDFFDIHNHILT